MNILIIFHSPIIPSHGGVERVTFLLSKGLREREHKVVYLCTSPSPQTDTSGYDSQQHFLYSDIKDKSIEQQYLEILEKERINIVLSQEATPDSLNLLMLTPDKIKTVSAYHVQPFRFVGKERIVKKASRSKGIFHSIYRQACILCPLILRSKHRRLDRICFEKMCIASDKIVLLSERFITRIGMNWPDYNKEKLTAINNPNTFDFPTIDSRPSEKEKLIIFVGRIEETQKNVKGFIDMWKAFSLTHPDWTASIVGDGPDRELCEKYAIKIGVRNLSFEGRQKNVKSYYQRAAFVCLTSHYEGWGMCLTEGMAYGCIPVCFDSYESSHDIIQNGVDGIIAKSFSSEDMSRRISEIADHDDRFKSMSYAAKRKVIKFNLQDTVTKWEQLFQNI